MFVLQAPAQAVQGIPYYINFQGRLADNNGNILPDGSYNIRFRIFNVTSGGSSLWTGDRSFGASDHRVSVTNGLFSVQFGDTSQGDPALSPTIFNSATQLYLEIELPSTATNNCGTSNCAAWTEGPFTPRQPIAASPYAFNSDTLDGLDSADFGQITAANTFSDTNTFSKSGGAGIILSGTPASAGSLLQVGSTLSSGNSNGTLIGANGAFSGDLINLQVSNATKLKVDNSGNLTLASGATITVGSSSGASTTCSGGQVLQNQVTVGGIVTGGTCGSASSGASTALDNLTTTSINQNLLADSNNARDLGSSATVWAHTYTALVDAGTTTTTLGIGTTNATAITIGQAGITTTVNGDLTVSNTINATAGYKINGTAGATTTCNGSQFMQGQTVEGGIVTGGTCGSLPVRSFIDTTADAVVDANTTSYWDNAAENNNTRPNLTPSDTSKEIFGILTVETQSTGTADVEVTARIEASTSGSTVCNSGTAVGGQPGTFASNTNARKTSTASFLHAPASTSAQYYNVCSDTDTVGTTANITRLRMTLFEVDNSNADLAEVYPTSDQTLQPAELLSMDPSIKGGVKRTAKAYDQGIIGVKSTSPGLLIGGKGAEGTAGVAVALSGRVPVLVSDENGPIQAGDPLTSSSTPGVAMKATKGGYVIGRAMQAFTDKGQGAVLAFVGTHFYSPDPTAGPDVMQDISTITGTPNPYVLPRTKPNDCISPDQRGSLYYDLAVGAVSVCADGGWEDVTTVSDHGLQLFGVQPGSGPDNQEGDLASLVSRGASGPCKVSYASPTSVKVEACTAYSGGHKVNVKAATLITALTNDNTWNHVCLSGSGGQPQIIAAPTEAANLPFSRTAPVLCLADIYNGGSGAAVKRIYDTRTFTNTAKEFATMDSTAVLGQVVVQSDRDGLVTDPPRQLGALGIRGVVIATSGSPSSTSTNVIIATSGPQFVKAAGNSKAGQIAQTSGATTGYTSSSTSGPSDNYASLGLNQRTIDATCSSAADCQFSQLIALVLR